jgi:hypothetical protein
MKLVLQVAAGVFLGILAVFGVYMLVQKWEARVYARQLAEQQKKAAKDIILLTPDEFTSHCGPPLNTVSNLNDEGGWGWVAMYYIGSDEHKVEVYFNCSKGGTAVMHCFFERMRRVDRAIYDSRLPAPYEDYETDGQFHVAPQMKEVEELPCLAGQR